MDDTGVSSVSSIDLLGIIADYLLGHCFLPDPNGLIVLNDGSTCSNASRGREFLYSKSAFPLSISGASEFKVVVHDAIQPSPPHGCWPICVGLIHPLATDIDCRKGHHSILLFSDNEYKMGGRYQKLPSFAGLEIPWAAQTTVTVRVARSYTGPTINDADADADAVFFIVNGCWSDPIAWQNVVEHSILPKVDPRKWIPIVGISPNTVNSISILPQPQLTKKL